MADMRIGGMGVVEHTRSGGYRSVRSAATPSTTAAGSTSPRRHRNRIERADNER
jgi:hypothetical protein